MTVLKTNQDKFDIAGISLFIVFLIGMINMIWFDNSTTGLYITLCLGLLVIFYAFTMLLIEMYKATKDLIKWIKNKSIK